MRMVLLYFRGGRGTASMFREAQKAGIRIYDFRQPTKLKLGDIVTNNNVVGTVQEAGPYGDDPFQVYDTTGKYHNFIQENGLSSVGKDMWFKI